jgi:hypothetical protein
MDSLFFNINTISIPLQTGIELEFVDIKYFILSNINDEISDNNAILQIELLHHIDDYTILMHIHFKCLINIRANTLTVLEYDGTDDTYESVASDNTTNFLERMEQDQIDMLMDNIETPVHLYRTEQNTYKCPLCNLFQIPIDTKSCINESCPICLDKIEIPITLDCNHGICIPCIEKMKEYNDTVR